MRLCVQRSLVLLLTRINQGNIYNKFLFLILISENAGKVHEAFEVNISDDSLLRAIVGSTSLLLVKPRQLSLFLLSVELITG